MYSSPRLVHLNIASFVGVTAFMLSAIPGRADALDQLHLRNPLPTPDALDVIGFGGGQFLAADARGDVFRTINGTVWAPAGNVGTNVLKKLAYGNNRFVGYTLAGNVLASADGSEWTVQSVAPENVLSDLAFGGGKFVLNRGANSQAFTLHSTDGFNWSTNVQTLEPGRMIQKLAYGDGVFVGAGSGLVFTSPDALQWTKRTPDGNFASPSAIVHGDGRFVVSGFSVVQANVNGGIWISTNSVDWNRVPGTATYGLAFSSMAYGNGRFVGAAGPFNSSTDGNVWNPITLPAGAGNPTSVAFGNGMFVAVGGGGIVTSADGAGWSNVPIVAADRGFTATSGAYGAGRYVLAGSALVTSADGIAYSRSSVGAVNAVTYAGGQFIAVGSSGKIVRSTDGLNWQPSRSFTLEVLRSVAHGVGRYVAVGDRGVIRFSEDGVLWYSAFSGTDYSLASVTYGNGKYVAVGLGGAVLISSDGVSWAPQRNEDFSDLSQVIHGQGKFLAAGAGGAVLSSADGLAWTRHPNGIAHSLTGLSYGSGLYVAVGSSAGDSGAVFTSADGVNWELKESPALNAVQGVSFLNNTFVLGGSGGTILQSDPVGGVLLRAAANPVSGAFEVRVQSDKVGSVLRLQSCGDLSVGQWVDVLEFTQTALVTTVVVPPGAGVSPSSFFRAVTP